MSRTFAPIAFIFTPNDLQAAAAPLVSALTAKGMRAVFRHDNRKSEIEMETDRAALVFCHKERVPAFAAYAALGITVETIEGALDDIALREMEAADAEKAKTGKK